MSVHSVVLAFNDSDFAVDVSQKPAEDLGSLVAALNLERVVVEPIAGVTKAALARKLGDRPPAVNGARFPR